MVPNFLPRVFQLFDSKELCTGIGVKLKRLFQGLRLERRWSRGHVFAKRGINMLWLLLTASALGILLGLWLRVSALLGASVALVVAATVLMTLGQWSLLQAIGFIYLLLITLQVGYLVGLLLSGARRHLASRQSPPQVFTCGT